MEDLIGVYGILDLDHWPNAPFLLLDGGVEKRWKEPYAFHNTDRGTYAGWLMQYTLSGTGQLQKTEKRMKCVPGEDFCVRFRRIADIICIRNPKNHGFFCIFIFVEVQCPMRQNDCLKKQEMFFMRMQIASQFGLHCRCIEN